MSKQIRIVALRMGEKPQVEMIDSGLDAMQKFVGGYIECVQLDGDLSNGCDLWCNEEGLFTCKPNRHVTVGDWYSQTINGPMFIAAHDRHGNTVSLSKARCEQWLKLSAEWPRAISSLPEDEKPEEGELLLIM